MYPSKSKATLKDIEKKTGLSVATISRAINGKSYVSEENKRKIYEAQKELNYFPKKEPPLSESNLILLSLPDNKNPFWFDYLLGIQTVCKKHNYYPLLSFTDIEEKEEVQIIKSVQRLHVAGLIVVTISATDVLSNAIKDIGIPKVLCAVHSIPNNKAHRQFDCISVDSEKGIQIATTHLIDQGHDVIAYLGLTTDTITGFSRLSGYQEAMQNHGKKIDSFLVRLCSDSESEQNGYDSIYDFYKSNRMPTAVCASNDRIALGVLKACKELNIRVPEQLAIVGMDNTDITYRLDPTISSIDIAPLELGKISAKMLFSRMADQDMLYQNTVLEPKLITKKSSVRRMR